MKPSISQVLFFLTLTFSSTVFGQGRVDNDPVLYNIWWTTYKIDNDISLSRLIKTAQARKDSIRLISYYSKKDSIYKIVELTTKPVGTKMKTFYFKDNKPIFISVKINNCHLTSDTILFSNVIRTFNDVADTNSVRQERLYKNNYQAKYFFYQGNVRYANIMTGDIIRVDNKRDIEQGLKLYNEGKKYLMTKP